MKTISLTKKNCKACPFNGKCPSQVQQSYFCPLKSGSRPPMHYVHQAERRQLKGTLCDN